MPFYLEARSRLYRAKAHRDEFGKQWAAFLDDEPYSPGVSVEDDGQGHIFVGSRYEQLPDVFSFLLGEMLYQLRAALDTCIYQAAVMDSGRRPPPNEQALAFPICRTTKSWKDSAGKIAPLTQRHREIVEAVQPCFAEKLPPDMQEIPRTLSILNDWARLDRHRRLNVLGSWGANRNPQLRLPPGTSLKWIRVTGDGFLEHEDKVAEFAIDGWEPGMHIEANPDLTIDVAVDEAPPPADESDTLSERSATMVRVVETVVGLFEQGDDRPHGRPPVKS